MWLQGQAEFYLEKLHGEVEKQLEPFLKDQRTPEEWKKYRETLIGLTDVTHSHFDKLVQVCHRFRPCMQSFISMLQPCAGGVQSV